MKKITLIILFIIVKNISAQSVYYCNGTSVNVRPTACNTDVVCLINNPQAFVVKSTTGVTCGFSWYQIDIPNAHNQAGYPLTAYVATTLMNLSSSPTNYLIVQNPAATSGLLIKQAVNGAQVWIYNSGFAFNWASFEPGQLLARTPAAPVVVGIDTWYEVYLTTNCYNGSSTASGTRTTGWVSNGISNGGGANVLAYGCTNPGNPTSVSGTAIGQTSASLSWLAGNPPGSATITYYWVIGTSTSIQYNGTGVIDQGTTTATSATTNLLSPNTTYYLRVFACTNCGGGGCSPDYGSSAQFSTSAGCSYSIFPSNFSFSSSAGGGSFSVTASIGCNWTAVSSNTSWLTITSGANGSGNGIINYSLISNPLSISRSATIIAGGQIFTVTQAGTGCSYSISPGGWISLSPAAGTGTTSVTTTAGCSWTAISNNTTWLNVTSGSGGTGNGTVSFSYTNNNLSTSRTGSITIAGHTFSVSQTGNVEPVVNSLVCTNVISNHPGLLQNYTFYSTNTPYSSNSPIKICADGATATYFKVNVSNTSGIDFRVLDEFGAPITDTEKYGQIGTTNVFGNDVEVAYTHPQYMDANGLFRPCTLEVLFNGSPIGGISFPINIYRAPIVFVHGLWGSDETFEEMENILLDNLKYPPIPNSPLIEIIDYQKTSLFHFYTNRKIVPNGIDDVLKKARNANYSTGKVIVIGHSMGGILSRLYLQSTYETNTQYRFDIQKLITANTPHYGTQFANWGLDYFQNAVDVLKILTPRNAIILTAINSKENPLLGAVKDLQVDSRAIQNDLNIPIPSQNIVASATLSTDENGDNSPNAVAIRGRVGKNRIKSIFSNEANDLIVPMTSQQGGIFVKPTIQAQWHISSTRNVGITNQITNLINSPPNAPDFSLAGFMPHLIDPPNFRPVSNKGISAKIAAPGDSLKIISPNLNQVFNPSDIVSVNIVHSGNLPKMVLIIYGVSIELNPITIDTSSVNQIDFHVPIDAIGRLHLLLLGGDSSNWKVQDESYIMVSPPNSLDSISVGRDSINLPLGLFKSITLNGYFNSKNTGINLNESSSLKLEYDSTILSYDGAGAFRGIKIGNTKVVYVFQGKSDTLNFNVYDNPNVLTSSFDYTVDKLCQNNVVAFQDQSLGLAVGYNWSFPGGNPSSSTLKDPTVIYSNAGLYSVALKTTFVNGVDSLLIDSVINVLPSPNVSTFPSGNIEACEGDTIVLSAHPDDFEHYTYLWNNNSGFVDNPALSSGTYFVTLTDSNGCNSTSAPVNINFHPRPIATIIPSGSIDACPGDSATFITFTSNSFIWSNGDSTNTTIKVNTPGDYFITVTDSNGCISKSDLANLSYYPTPIPPLVTALGDTNFCAGGYVVLHSDDMDGFNWNNGDTAQNFIVTHSGNYFIKKINSDGCFVQSVPISIAVYPLPVATVNTSGSLTFCVGDSITLSCNPANSYLWNNGNTTQNITIFNTSTNFVSITDSNQCIGISAPINVSVNSPTQNSITQSTCSSYSINGQIYNSSGHYTQLLTNSLGCDSLITIDLTVNSPTTNTIYPSACDNYSLNGQTYNASGSYPQTLVNTHGCDSTITVNLTINSSTTNAISLISCNSYSLNGQTYTVGGTYTQTLNNSYGCDSILTLNLTINKVDTLVSNSGGTLTADSTATTFQWVDCQSQIPIPNAINPSFTPTVSGNYSVIITQNNCTDTSACYQVIVTGIPSINSEPSFAIYPNPANNIMNISASNLENSFCSISIKSLLGQILFQDKIKVENGGLSIQINVNNYSTGLYFLTFENNSIQKMIKFEKR